MRYNKKETSLTQSPKRHPVHVLSIVAAWVIDLLVRPSYQVSGPQGFRPTRTYESTGSNRPVGSDRRLSNCVRYIVVAFSAILLAISLPDHSSAELATTFDAPDTAYASNVVIDIIEHNGGVWFATGEGVNYSMDGGSTWLLYDQSNGLTGENISSLFSINGRLWIAGNHTEDIAGTPTTISDTLIYSDDNGQTWVSVALDTSVIYAVGGDRTVFDITGHDNWMFTSGFAAGFLASRDGGISWRRIFPSPSDSTNYVEGHVGLDSLSLLNRYFSCGVDTSHLGSDATINDDSLYVWAGTAGGLVQYIFADRHLKPFSEKISGFAFCGSCGNNGEGLVFIGGENGLAIGKQTGAPYRSRFSDDPFGLPETSVTALTYFGGVLFAGTLDSSTGSASLAISSDQGDTWSQVLDIDTTTVDTMKEVADFVVVGNRVYAAASEAGLFFSTDTGQTWQKLPVVTDPNSSANVVHVVDALADTLGQDTLLVGTDSGAAFVFMQPDGSIDSTFVKSFPESVFSSTKVIGIRPQTFINAVLSVVDSVAIWTINDRLTVGGTRMLTRVLSDSIRIDQSWANLQVDQIINDINFKGDTAMIVGDRGVQVALVNPDSAVNYRVVSVANVNETLDNDVVTSMEITGSAIYFGTENGFAFSSDTGQSYRINRPNTDSLTADAVLEFTVKNSFTNFRGGVGLTGNWIPVLGVQYQSNGDDANIWVSARSTGRSGDTSGVAIARGVTDTVTINYINPDDSTIIDSTVKRPARLWERAYSSDFAWNFAFNGDTTFAATNSGLIYNVPGPVDLWDTVAFLNVAGEQQILDGTPVFAVEVIGNSVWVGTDDRTMRLDLATLVVDTTFFVIDSTTPADIVYAFPVPFSHTGDLGVEFHFSVEQEADITLEIYDFAMNLVSRPIDNVRYPPGKYPTVGAFRSIWDGTNGKGDEVAVGIYYFKVMYSTGEVRWGKLAVTP